MVATDSDYLLIGGVRLEVQRTPPRVAGLPTLVLLHEGLGCVALWRDFPVRLAAATGCGVLAYSRAGYGQSDPVTLPRSLRYMHEEAIEVLPRVLESAAADSVLLIGHSDGASIAIIHAAVAASERRPLGLMLEAPHVFVEERGLDSIRAAREAYLGGHLRRRLARYHRHVDVAFWGWNRAWLDPGFASWNLEEYLPALDMPILLLQQEDDPYGSAAQLDAIASGSRGRVIRLILPGRGHAPHADHADQVLAALTAFTSSVLA
jgi:pimeloyl-ACP methyl ester carboxylesterase